MRRKAHRASVLGFLVGALLLPPLALGGSAQALNTGTAYPNASWALGVVAPEGSRLSDGTGLHWESVGNITALVALPNITLPDRVVYSILSVMTIEGGVMQVAAGVYPNRTTWMAYSWAIPNSYSIPVTYKWILNGSEPKMRQNDSISMSVFRTSGLWNLRVVDKDTESSVMRSFPPAVGSTLMVGDQEVFALESYSSASSTFRTMGNMTLEALLVDGQKVTNGFYAYGGWDPNHSPLFAVGSSGALPPAFISLSQPRAGSFVWGFSGLWQAGPVSDGGWVVVFAATGMVTVFVIFLAWRVATRNTKVHDRGVAGSQD